MLCGLLVTLHWSNCYGLRAQHDGHFGEVPAPAWLCGRRSRGVRHQAALLTGGATGAALLPMFPMLSPHFSPVSAQPSPCSRICNDERVSRQPEMHTCCADVPSCSRRVSCCAMVLICRLPSMLQSVFLTYGAMAPGSAALAAELLGFDPELVVPQLVAREASG